ncbi:hypothetical protein DM02DRAFT_623370 [Periconia macrospinosa]|uniref:CFEM domain-containing protein n=1 Tax=Periconia macrospinosa TaxID=97972 RepID=A0A2V1E7D8_9PLEO|nr:hypothetical protein DM02DRAFT_623370 [Periconia macrospinosa]
MRFSLSAVAFAASLAFVNAQDLSGIPSCALTCFAAAVPASGCSLTDTKCQCTTGRDKVQGSLTQCVPERCSADDQTKVASAVVGICERAGVTVSNLPTAAPTAASGNTTGLTGSRTSSTPSATRPAQQTGNVAAVNVMNVGVLAAGMAAVFAL